MEGVAPRSRWRLARDLIAIGLAGALLVVGTYFGYRYLATTMYGPGAFVKNYLTLLSEGRAADALVVPGVSIDSAVLEAAGIDPSASDALLRRAALAPLSDIEITSEKTEGDVTLVTATYSAGGVGGSTTFAVSQNGWDGLAPSWKFDETPLGMINLKVNGSMTFSINGFTVDKRQVSASGVDAIATDPVPMLVFAPGLYSVAVDTAVSTAKGTAVLADAPLTPVDLEVQSEPTPEFVRVVQEKVNSFLTNDCASQQVLQPTNCPFGLTVQNRIASVPQWEMTSLPVISIEPNGADWMIPTVDATATVTVEMQSLYDGSTWERVEEVPFRMNALVQMTPDGQASITITGVDTE